MIYKLDVSAFKDFKTENNCILTAFVVDKASNNDGYPTYFKMFIKSIILTNKENSISLLVIYNKESYPIINKVLSSYKEELLKTKINVYLLDNEPFEVKTKGLTVFKGYPSAILYRLFVSFLLPNIKRFLWLDIDIIVCISLSTLFNKDISDYSFVGYRDIDDTSNGLYLNSGVSLINAFRIRNRYKSLDNLIKTYVDYNCVTDQGFIIVDDDYYIIDDLTYNYPGIYNRLVHSFLENFLVLNRLKYLAKNTKIFHFYSKDSYKGTNIILNIMKENSPIFRECFSED